MEYVPSRSLADVLRDRAALPPHEVAAIGTRVAGALAAAHAAGIVHRDVKPGNILLTGDGTVKITDFGISRATGDVTVTSSGLLGTPAFLAPEVARGEPATPASDVFSLGSTLFAAVEGTPPFGTADNPITQLHRAAAGQTAAPRQAGPLADPLARMLHDDPAARPDMTYVAAALDTIGAPRPAPTGTQSPTMSLPAGGAIPAVAAGGRAATRVDLPPVAPAPLLGSAPAPTRPRRRPLYLVVGLLACLLLALALAVVLSAPDRPSPAGAPGNGSTAIAPGAGGSPTPVRHAPSPALLQQAVSAYYALLPDKTEQAWTRLGPSLQAQGRDSYDTFWHGIKDVHILTAPRASGTTVTVTLEFKTKNRGRIQETHRLGLLMRSGTALINTDHLISSQTVGNVNGNGNDGNGNGNGDGGD
jgi:hypothetical protein